MTAVAAMLSGAPLPMSGLPGGAASIEMALPGFAAIMAAALPGSAPVMIDDAVLERPLEATPVVADVKSAVSMAMTGAVSAGADAVAVLPRRRGIVTEPPVTSPAGGKRANADGLLARRRAVPSEPFEPAATAPVAPLAVVAGLEPPAIGTPGAGPVKLASARPDVVETVAGEASWRRSVDTALQRVVQPAPTLVPWIMAGMPPVATPPTGLDGNAGTVAAAVSLVPAIVRAEQIVAPELLAMPGPWDIAGARYYETGGPESFLPSPRFALAVLDAISARSSATSMATNGPLPPAGLAEEQSAVVLPMVVERGESGAPTTVLADLPAGSQPVAAPAAPAVVMAARADVPEPRLAGPVPAEMTIAATTPQLGEVRIGLDGSAQALRVTMTVGSGAASVLADAPRLAADLAANGLRLQALEVGDAGSSSPAGVSTGWNAPSGGEGRPRFVPPPSVAANVFANEQAALLPSRARPASDRYA